MNGQMYDRQTDTQTAIDSETIIPYNYPVAGYKNEKKNPESTLNMLLTVHSTFIKLFSMLINGTE